MRILIVEDYVDTANSLRAMFEARGVDCDLARTVKTAAEMFNIRCDSGLPCYDGALLDLSLPDAFGTVLLKAMREVHPDLPIFTVTAFVDDFVRNRCAAAHSPIVLKPGFTFDGSLANAVGDIDNFVTRVVDTITDYNAHKVIADHPRLILPAIIERLINEAAA